MPLQTPCAHLIECTPPECGVGRRFPEDCANACAAYSPGLTEQERTRCEIWSWVITANNLSKKGDGARIAV